MKPIKLLLIAVTVAGQASAQAPSLPVPKGKDSAAVAAIFSRYAKALGAPTAPSRFIHVKQQMEGPGAEPMEMEQFMITAAPGKQDARVRSLMNMPMMGQVETVVNRENGWVLSPMGPPTLLPKEQLEPFMKSSNPEAMMSMPQGKLSKAPRTTIDGREMDGVRFVDSLGTDATMYFDVKTGLPSAVKANASRSPMMDTSMVVLLSDYKSFDGMLRPTTISMRQASGQTMVMRVTLMEFTPIDTMMFVPPPAVLELLKQKLTTPLRPPL